ncbi:MAG: 16S rRNA (uracil(1498)-N(3))-methyltransferase [Opitutaceae bacterium]|nr:16S rRNA (uracil(1498)-N(3))-methyltransferase [Opitutaceae bacterium]
MPDFRSHCPTPADAANAAELTLSADESHHLVVVNRARRGAPVVAFDGHGREWICELARDSKTAALLKVISTRQAAPLPCRITLAQALPKGPSMDAIVRKATEIGAARIVPLESERTQVHLDTGREDKKTVRWRIAALEAAKQCGNPWLPEILPVQNATAFMRESAKAHAAAHATALAANAARAIAHAAAHTAAHDAALAADAARATAHAHAAGAATDDAAGAATNDADARGLRLIASLHDGARTLKTVLADYRAAHDGRPPRDALWLIGPEGDFSPAEMREADAAGIIPVTLGPLVLRCETAATYALSILSYELQTP